MQKNWSLKILNSFKKLSELDDDLKYIINKYNLPDSRKESNTFETLMRIIIGQQISRKAAESIYQKLKGKKITISWRVIWRAKTKGCYGKSDCKKPCSFFI